MTDPTEIEEARADAADRERRRIVGIILAEYAVRKMTGQISIADMLDALANTIEHSAR